MTDIMRVSPLKAEPLKNNFIDILTNVGNYFCTTGGTFCEEYAEMIIKSVDLYQKKPSNVSNWQPIETAPKDGTYILLFQPGVLMPDMTVCAWFDDWWMACDGKNPELILRGIGPTHWMPLPSTP